jgi:hypothetical protein
MAPPTGAEHWLPAGASGWSFGHRSRSGRQDEPPAHRLTEEEAYLVGSSREFCDQGGKQMYMRASGSRGSQLRRRVAIEACIVSGMPTLPGTTAFAHIHGRDLHLAPCNDSTRVFCLCWHHHHGCYDQSYISTVALLQAEEIWIQNKRRPKPHQRDDETDQQWRRHPPMHLDREAARPTADIRSRRLASSVRIVAAAPVAIQEAEVPA